MTSLAWKLNRLRVMSAPEIAHRSYRWGAQQIEKFAILHDRVPHPPRPVVTGIAMFEGAAGWRNVWRQHFSLNDAKLNDLIHGRIDLFGYGTIDFGCPPDWQRDPVTSVRAPTEFGKTLDYRDETRVGNVKVLWELGRHQHLIPIAAAFALSGQARYRDAVVKQIDSWVAENPFGMGIHWCSSLEAGLRLVAWAIIDGLLRLDNPSASLITVSNDPARLGVAIYQQAWFVRHFLSRYSSANNHLIGELTGLFVATTVFDCGDIGIRWNEFARRELESQARKQVHPDGVGKEQSVYYHLWVLEYFLVVYLIAKRAGTPMSEHFAQRIQAMDRFLDDVSVGDTGPPQIGDSDDGCVARFDPLWPRRPYADVQKAVDVAFGRGDDLAGSQKAFFYRLISPSAGNTVAPDTSRPFPLEYRDGGYAIVGDERVRLILDAGDLGYPAIAAHGHADALGFCLAIDDFWWLVDPGTFSYHGDQIWRDYFRGTSAHNTIVVEDRNQSTIGGPFLWLDRARASLESVGLRGSMQIASGSHNGYRRLGLTHHREIQYDPGNSTIEIADRLFGSPRRQHIRAQINYHFAPTIDVVLEANSATATRPDNNQALKLDLPASCEWRLVRGTTDPVQGWYSPQIGTKVPATVLCGGYDGIPSCSFTTRIALPRIAERRAPFAP